MGDEMGTGCGIVALLVIIAMFAMFAWLEPIDTSDGAVVTVAEVKTVDRGGATSGGNVAVMVLSSLGAAIGESIMVICSGGLVGWIGLTVLVVLGLLGLAGSR